MTGTGQHNRRGAIIGLAAVWLLLIGTVGGAHADAADERMVNVGLKIFPAVIAASDKLTTLPVDEHVKVSIVYLHDKPLAGQLVERLQHIGSLRGYRIDAEAIAVDRLPSLQRPPFALFIAERMGDNLDTVLDYARQHNAISFSPFRGDVERGVLAGIVVSDRILPYINLRTLSGLQHNLRPFFMKVAETYEP